MMNMLRSIWARIEAARMARARAEVREHLLRLSDHNLAGIGVSRELLARGDAAGTRDANAAIDGKSLAGADLERPEALGEQRADGVDPTLERAA